MSMGMDGPGIMFSIMPLLFMIVFVVVFGMIIFTIVSSIKTWNKNNHSPRLSVPAKIVSKRENIRRHRNSNNNHTTTSTDYYVTFEYDSGDRSEFKVRGSEYGLLVEGDLGIVEFQGTRYLGFERRD